MARYIDADKMREEWLENGENEFIYDTNAVLDSIDSQPTADVAPAKHGEWVKPNPYNRFMDCSVCGFFQDHKEFNYCPNCGAKMGRGNG